MSAKPERAPFQLDEQKLRRAFLEEAEELLEKLGQSLLALERAPGDAELINEVFRLTHSLKSGSALAGLQRLSSLAHRLEDVFDAVRRSTIALSRPLMDRVFGASDLLHELLRRIGREGTDEGVELGATLAELETLAGLPGEGAGVLTAAHGPPTEEGARLDEFQRALVQEALDRGESIHRIEVRIDEAAELLYPRAYLVFNALETATNLIRSVPDMSAPPLEDARYRSPVFLVSSAWGAERLRELCSLDLISSVHVDSWDRGSLAASGLLEAEEYPPGQSAGRAAGEPGRAESPSVRVDTRKLNEIWQLVGELVTYKTHLVRVHDGVRRRSELEPVLSGEIERATDTLERITGEMQQAIMQTRMVPIAVLFRKFPRLVRDLTRKLGKAAELEVAGEETEIDRTIVEALSDPLTHVVRNSLDHGLEPPEERRGLGKSEVGRIRLSAQQQGGTIVIEVEDDGRGLDLERIRRKAGLPAEASREQITAMVFRPGFSTKDDVTDLSGRGVGLDVVATRIRDELRGEVELHSEEGRGTTIRLLLPLTLTILHSLVVRADRYRYAIPIRDIEQTVKVGAADRRPSPEGTRYNHQGADIPLLRLSALLQGAAEPPGDEAGPAPGEAAGVVLQQRDRRVCLIVDELVEEQDVVIKPVSDLLNPRRLFSGTSVLGDGTVLFILDTGRVVDVIGSGG